MKIIRRRLFLPVLALLCAFFPHALAEESCDVTIVPAREAESRSRVFTQDMLITFGDISLYNESVALSYHIYADADLTELLQYENVRVNFSLDASAQAAVQIDVDAREFNSSSIYIQYDIVDPINGYWFSSNPNLRMQTKVAKIHYDRFYELTQPLCDTVTKQPLQLIVNILVFALFVVAFVFVRKKRVLVFK